MKKEDFFRLFITSGLARAFERGNPKYVTGMSGVELTYEVFLKTGYESIEMQLTDNMNRSEDYWCGWILAYYQWVTGRTFENILSDLPFEKIEKLYTTLHEAPEQKFVEVANSIRKNRTAPTKLQQMRKKMKLTQAELSKESNVSLRSIQMYEQRNKNIDNASAITLLRLARVLGCEMEALLELEG